MRRFTLFILVLITTVAAMAATPRVTSVVVVFNDGSTQTIPATQPTTQPATTLPTTQPAPAAIVLASGAVGLQVVQSNIGYSGLSFSGGYQGLLFQGGVKNVTIDGFTSIDASGYGIYMGAGRVVGGLAENDSVTLRNIRIEMPTRGEHCWRIYNVTNFRAEHVLLINPGKVFTGTTLALKQGQGCVFEDLMTIGLAPALGPLPLAEEENYRLRDVQFIDYNASLTSYLTIGSGCINITFAPGASDKRCTIKQTKAGSPVLSFSGAYRSRPVATGISFTNYDFSAPAGSALVAGDASGCTFTNCTFNGKAIGLHGEVN